MKDFKPCVWEWCSECVCVCLGEMKESRQSQQKHKVTAKDRVKGNTENKMCGREIGGRKRGFEGIKWRRTDKREKAGKNAWNAECLGMQEDSRVSGNWLVSELLWSCRREKELNGSRSTQTAEPYLTPVTKPPSHNTYNPLHGSCALSSFKELRVTSQRKLQ